MEGICFECGDPERFEGSNICRHCGERKILNKKLVAFTTLLNDWYIPYSVKDEGTMAVILKDVVVLFEENGDVKFIQNKEKKRKR